MVSAHRSSLDNFPSSRASDEAVLVVDAGGVITFATANARELLGVDHRLVGRPLAGVDIPGRLGDLVRGAAEPHATTRSRGRYVEVRRLAARGTSALDSIVLIRDRTETVELFAELADIHAVVIGLRTRQHENANRLHIVLGFLQSGEHDEAVGYLKELVGMPVGGASAPTGGTSLASLAALLRTKANIAAARGVGLAIGELAPLEELRLDADSLASIVGNLVDNAIDAAVGSPSAAVQIQAERDAHEIRLIVRDTGGGVPDTVDVFTDGYTTKQPRVGMPRGFGLAFVRHLVARSAGTIAVHNDVGAVFTVRWLVRSS